MSMRVDDSPIGIAGENCALGALVFGIIRAYFLLLFYRFISKDTHFGDRKPDRRLGHPAHSRTALKDNPSRAADLILMEGQDCRLRGLRHESR